MTEAEPLWAPEELVAGLEGRAVGTIAPVTGLSIDTRTLQPGDLFVAIRGEARDGHAFLSDALAKGAAAAVVAVGQTGELTAGERLIAVDEPLRALERLAAAARRRSPARIAAVTGSVGKTSTKEALRLVLGRFGETHAAVASYNNHWGVPLTLARLPRTADFGVFEIGMNHAGEIAPLTRLVRPQVAIVTTIAPVHIEFFRSLTGITDAKGEIFLGLEPGGTAIINRDAPHADRLIAHARASAAGRVITFGEQEGADVRALRIAGDAEGSTVEASLFGRVLNYRLGAAGRHLALNSLAVLAAAHAFGLDLAEAAEALGTYAAPVGRGERTRLAAPGGDVLLIDESYNANPASVQAALVALGEAPVGPGGRRIAVLGDMRELGPEGPAHHRDLAAPVEANGVDLVFAAGELMAHLVEALPNGRRGGYAGAAAELLPTVLETVRPGDVVMIKGSNSIRMGTIVAALKERFPALSAGPDRAARA
jgi:UDP-N-acetylmuramoyl-tripeptide--D-alanyl-D-alanine ligase